MYFYCNYIIDYVVCPNLYCIIIMPVSTSHGVRPCADFMKVNKDDDNDEIKLTVCLRTTICKGNWCGAKIL